MSNSALATAINIPDIQGTPDTRQIPINHVGIKDIRHPVRIKGRDQRVQHTVANLTMTVNLPKDVKGTHMSRFVDILNTNETDISIPAFHRMLQLMLERLEAEVGRIVMDFTYFVNKAAPVTGVQSLLDYHVTLLGDIKNGQSEVELTVAVPVTSLCPCSKKISNYGAHNQRSEVKVSVRAHEAMEIEDIIDIVEKEASCELYGLLKRPDEKFVTERAYDNPKFVEDIVRDVAIHLNDDDNIFAYRVITENFESIHNHSAFAIIERDKRLD